MTIRNTAVTFKEPDPIEIEIVTSERTHHPMHVYLLLVGHTTTGFRIARDCLPTEDLGFK